MKNKLTKLVLASVLAGSLLSSPAFSAEITHPYHEKIDTSYFYYNGKPFAEINLVHDGIADKEYGILGAGLDYSNLDAPAITLKGLYSALDYCAQIFVPQGQMQNNNNTWRFFVTGFDQITAGCQPVIIKDIVKDGEGIDYNSGYNNDLVGIITDGNSSGTLFWNDDVKCIDTNNSKFNFTQLYVGKHLGIDKHDGNFGWYYDETPNLLTKNEHEADLRSVLVHEMGHALGMFARVLSPVVDNDKNILWNEISQESDGLDVLADKTIPQLFAVEENGQQNFANHLMDMDGKYAKSMMPIFSEAGLADYNKKHPNQQFERKDVFIVNPVSNDKVWFMGDNVSDVLEDAKFDGVNGIPVAGWFYDLPDSHLELNLSHIKLNGATSNKYYNNTPVFIEAELALFQDLGYKLDRKNFYGRSIYGDGLTIRNTQGYSARNADGTAYIEGKPNETAQGVGLHVYGSRNNITQAADILTNGAGAAGILLTGIENNLTIDKNTKVYANGNNAIGILCHYGKEHSITQNGTVTALGENGNAIVFDFGSDNGGPLNGYHGSYIYYFKYEVYNDEHTTVEDSYAYNISMKDEESEFNLVYENGELDGALTKSFDLNGTAIGKENAILVGKNAFVKDININDGANIIGNITSNWKDFHEENGNSYDAQESVGEDSILSLKIQYNDEFYEYTDYIPDLVTNLNFNANMNYDDNIKGVNNIKMNVKENTLNFSGTADVVSVNVDAGATLVGGTYNLQKQEVSKLDLPKEESSKGLIVNGEDAYEKFASDIANENIKAISNIAEENGKFIYTDTGIFVNDGTISAGKDGMKITASNELGGGDLTGSGTIRVESDAFISVSGTADLSRMKIAGSKVMLGSGEKLKFIEAKEVIASDSNKKDVYSALANYELKVENEQSGESLGQAGVLTFEVANNMKLEDNLYSMVEKEDALLKTQKLSAGEKDNFELFTGLEKEGALKTFSELQEGMHMDMAYDAMKNKAVRSAIHAKAMDIVSKDADNKNWWASMGKAWDRVGDVKAHGATMATGYDFVNTENKNVGAMFSYNDRSLSNDKANVSGEYKEYGVALYGSKQSGAGVTNAYVSYAHQNNDAKGALSALGATAKSKFGSNTYGAGVSYAYDLQHGKDNAWHVSPYAALDYAHYKQNGFKENGGLFGLGSNGYTDDYADASLGLSFKRSDKDANYVLGAAYVRNITGAEHTLNLTQHGMKTALKERSQVEGKNRLALSAYADKKLGDKWNAAGYVEKSWAKGGSGMSVNVELGYKF